jgi:choline/glycine/proline betaine transport protein
MIYLAFSKFGHLRIGGQTQNLSLKHCLGSRCFSAGMGIGLLFWSISEPVYHFLNQWQKEELLKLRKL